MKKGFTLIELILVLAIAGIITAITIPALMGARHRRERGIVNTVPKTEPEQDSDFGSSTDSGSDDFTSSDSSF